MLRRVRDDAGMVTAELAAGLPVLVIVLAVAVVSVSVAGAQVRAEDAAAQAARALAREDPDAAQDLLRQLAPKGASLSVRRGAGDVEATVRVVLHPLGGRFGSITISESAVAASEPAPGPS
jgi:Flp pilus assembly protein TadG